MAMPCSISCPSSPLCMSLNLYSSSFLFQDKHPFSCLRCRFSVFLHDSLAYTPVPLSAVDVCSARNNTTRTTNKNDSTGRIARAILVDQNSDNPMPYQSSTGPSSVSAQSTLADSFTHSSQPNLSSSRPSTLPTNSSSLSLDSQGFRSKGPAASSLDAAVKSTLGGNAESSEFYDFKEGDIILGVVISGNEIKLDVEIGADKTAVLPYRDLQMFPQVALESLLFELSTNSSDVSLIGRSLLVKDKNEIIPSSQPVECGTIVVAEVENRTLLDDKALLSCRSVARRFSWNRILQLMQVGERILFEVQQFNAGGLLGNVEGVRAFLPRSELLKRSDSPAKLQEYVGKVLSVSIIEADVNVSNLVISELKPWMQKNLTLGSVHDVIVTQVYPSGVQMEINDTRLRGFLHISSVSNQYVRSVTEHFQRGDSARVMSVKGRSPQQVAFSIAQLESDDGLFLRDKERVYQEADEVAMKFREGLSEEERVLFRPLASDANLEPEVLIFANMQWLHLLGKKASA